MKSHSALARLQQATTFTLVAASLGWLVWHWTSSPARAVIGFLLIAMGYSLFLAAQFVVLRFVGGHDGTTRPRIGELVRAWLGETAAAPRVFAWRQPFRWRAVPDLLEPGSSLMPKRGVVFIHGFVCNRGFWTPWLERLRALGHPFVAVNLEPVFGSIDDYVPVIEDAVERVTKATGLSPVLVCHSMGGLAARAWLAATHGHDRVHHVITIGSPHHGTWLGRFSHMVNGSQMRLGSDWIQALESRGATAHRDNFTCWYSNCDNIVFPVATATLPGADNRLIRGVAHVELAFDRRVMDASLEKIAS